MFAFGLGPLSLSQLSAFMSMNMDRHVKAHRELYENIAKGDTAKAAVTKAF